MVRRFRPLKPIGFTPLPVTIITSLVYAALLVALLVTHLMVPPAPSKPVEGIDLTEAWRDLQDLSNGFHPYNSRRNDYVRDWLLRRIEAILDGNKIHHSNDPFDELQQGGAAASHVVVFNDITSNTTFSTEGAKSTSGRENKPGTSVYFEGTNIIVYIRGSEDKDGDWWNKPDGRHDGLSGVLVNAHYDSVSTGFGATDDGVGVITILQLIKYFTSSGHTPKRGIVALLNNGEEDFLNGARAFTQHPMSSFVHTFLNLEGAGAGGRATLFRSTDTEVTRYYQRSPYPFGTVLSSDGFNRGLIRSQTDYVVFNDLLGLRGLDVAFMKPRARYHTDQDDARHTSVDSLWHMLSAALATIQGLTSDTSSLFEGESVGKAKVQSGQGSVGVWFDLFGRGFAVFELQILFALSISLLVATPIVLIVVLAILYKFDKLYMFSGSKHHHHPEGDDTVALYGWRGFFRYPVIFIVASGAVVGLAFLLTKVNPYIVYSSQYAVWSMMLSAWLFVAWFGFRAIDFVRPTALHRAYCFFWMYLGGWVALVVATVFEQSHKMAGVYFVAFYFSAIFLATAISFSELFALPRKSEYADIAGRCQSGSAVSPRSGSISSSRLLAPAADERVQESADQEDNDNEEPTESTSLIRSGRHPTFAHYTGSGQNRDTNDDERTLDDTKMENVFGDEQGWSSSMLTWTWLLQFILLAPIVVILIGQIGLLLTSAMHQTAADGNSVLLVYIAIAVFTVLILTPLAPFLHRWTYHVPGFLLLVLTGTLIYNLIAFAFSTNNRLKLRFIQTIDLETAINEVSLTGVEESHLAETIRNLPSAAGQDLSCKKDSGGLSTCSWHGLPPRVVGNTHPNIPPELGYADWLSFNVTRTEGQTEAHFHIVGRNTRACKITFDSPISEFSVDGAGHDRRFQSVSPDGSNEVRLWSRTWEKPWDVNIKWESHSEEGGLDGKVVCLWSDVNETGVIPAFEEVTRFAPEWVAITKLRDGLVEGSKRFMI
ncbi:hypothetical protein MMC16_004232 [Acarospora aff. strigata]|nr:hypothetical protein [Acarospora aff. strigata]